MRNHAVGVADAAAPLEQRVFQALARDGPQSAGALAASLGVSIGDIAAAIRDLRGLHTEIRDSADGTYALPSIAKPLDAAAIRSWLSPAVARTVEELRVLWSTDSTNARLLDGERPREGAAIVLLAEHQSAGRGRRGRTWMAPPGGSVCLSIGWSFGRLPPDAGALSLAMGVCARRALRDCGVAGTALKWPNDLVADGAKLGGILIELQTEATGPAFAVLGLGLNVALGARLCAAVGATGTQATDLVTLGLECSDRNSIAARLIEHCVAGLRQFALDGLRAFAAEWHEADALRGRQVTVHTGSGALAGTARGIDDSGGLMLETAAGLRSVVAGEVSVCAGR